MFKEIFAGIILAAFYPDASWLKELSDYDHMVEANTINFAQIGADPTVVINNAAWPLVPARRTDALLQVPLDTFDTTPTHVTNVEELETDYKKVESVVRQHKNSLYSQASLSAAYSLAPVSNTATTPVLATTGDSVAFEGGTRLKLKWEDIVDLSLAFNKANVPQDDRVLLLCPEHQADLKKQDIELYKTLIKDGTTDGFKVYMISNGPRYSDALNKLAIGAQTNNVASVAFSKSCVMRAMGTIEGEPEKRWSDYRGWLLGFQMRFIARPLGNKGIGALVSLPS